MDTEITDTIDEERAARRSCEPIIDILGTRLTLLSHKHAHESSRPARTAIMKRLCQRQTLILITGGHHDVDAGPAHEVEVCLGIDV
jgi:hypothetical protein